MKRDRRKVVYPIVVVGGAIVVAAALESMRAPIEAVPVETTSPIVRVLTAASESVRLTVRTNGTVVPRSEGDLVPEVSGRVVWVSPALVAGGFFAAGESLVRIETTDYETALRRAEANVAGLRSQAQLAARNRDRSRALARDGLLSRVDLDTAESNTRVAQAGLQEAEALLERSRSDLARTELSAPYAGRVRSEQIDVGQFVERGRAVARLYAVDYAEVRLPIPDAELAYLDLPLDGRDVEDGPTVHLTATFAGEVRHWQGRIVRTEGEIDPDSRMVHSVARVDDPYGRSNGASGPPLAVGMFVEAEIVGRRVDDAIVLPRAALREGTQVWVVTDAGTLEARQVELVRIDREQVVVGNGLAAGERVCLSSLDTFVDGMAVRTRERDA